MTGSLMTSIGHGIRQARLERALTQEKVADRVGLSAQFYGRLERGKALPSVVSLARLAAVLEVSADELLRHAHEDTAGPEMLSADSEHAADVEEYLKLDRLPVRRVMRLLRAAPSRTLEVVYSILQELEERARHPPPPGGQW